MYALTKVCKIWRRMWE